MNSVSSAVQRELEHLRVAVQASRAGNIQLFVEEQARRKARSKMLENYRPYQKQKDFHLAGADHRERAILSGNQIGKTTAAAAETAMHLTGLYPEWWQGKRFDRPVAGVAASETAKLVRDGLQVHLCGAPKYELGAGMIPSDLLLETPPGSSLRNAFDYAKVRHKSGGEAILYFRSYDQGSDRVQAMTLDLAWMDEESQDSYYFELLARTSAVLGPVYITMTPLKGMTKVVQRFMGGEPGCSLTSMTLEDALHYTPEQRAALIASYPPYIREARAYGRPSKGSGVVYPVTDESISCDPIPIPSFWRQIGGLDLGGSGDDGHPTAAVRAALDPDGDVLYITQTYRVSGGPVYQHAAALKSWSDTLPWAWPHDALQHERKSGETIKSMLERHGMSMLPESAQFEDGSNSVNAGVEEILERMLTGRLKVFRHLNDWFQELGMYHRKNGVIVKQNDDLMDAARYAVMMLRHAQPQKQERWKKAPGYVEREWV